MKHDQDIIDPPITAGDYVQIIVPVYADKEETTLETDLASGVVEWHLRSTKDVDSISKTTGVINGGITVDTPEVGHVVVELLEDDTADIRSGDYYHIAEFTLNSVKKGLFDGILRIDNR
jgi:hypothetical protein